MCGEFELLLVLGGSWNRIRRNILHGVAYCAERGRRLRLVQLIHGGGSSVAGGFRVGGDRWRDWAVKGADAVHVYVFQPVLSTPGVRRRIDPAIGPAGMFGKSSIHQQGRSGDQRRIHGNALAGLFAVNVESKVVRLAARLPMEYHALRASFIFTEVGGERFQLDVGGGGDSYGDGRTVASGRRIPPVGGGGGR